MYSLQHRALKAAPFLTYLHPLLEPQPVQIGLEDGDVLDAMIEQQGGGR